MNDEGWAAIPTGMLRDPEVPQLAKLVYVALQSHVNYRSGSAAVRMQTMADYLGISRRSVFTHLHWLRDHGFIEWSERHVEGSTRAQLAHEYRLLIAPGFKGVVQNLHNLPGAADAQGVVQQMHTKNKNTLNQKKDSSSKASGLDAEPTPIVAELCEYLAEWIVKNGGKRPTVGKRWHTACRLMIDVDHRAPENIRTAIDWCQKDEFWRANILSMTSLRDKYDQLRLAAQRSGTTGRARAREDQALDVVRRLQEQEEQQGGIG